MATSALFTRGSLISCASLTRLWRQSWQFGFRTPGAQTSFASSPCEDSVHRPPAAAFPFGPGRPSSPPESVPDTAQLGRAAVCPPGGRRPPASPSLPTVSLAPGNPLSPGTVRCGVRYRFCLPRLQNAKVVLGPIPKGPVGSTPLPEGRPHAPEQRPPQRTEFPARRALLYPPSRGAAWPSASPPLDPPRSLRGHDATPRTSLSEGGTQLRLCTPTLPLPPPTSQGSRASGADAVSHVPGLQLGGRRRLSPGPFAPPGPAPPMPRSHRRFPSARSAG